MAHTNWNYLQSFNPAKMSATNQPLLHCTNLMTNMDASAKENGAIFRGNITKKETPDIPSAVNPRMSAQVFLPQQMSTSEKSDIVPQNQDPVNFLQKNTTNSRTVTSVICSWDELPLMLSTAQASKVLGYSTGRVRELCNAGILPCIRVGRHFRIPKEALRQWIMTTSRENLQEDTSSTQAIANFKQHTRRTS